MCWVPTARGVSAAAEERAAATQVCRVYGDTAGDPLFRAEIRIRKWVVLNGEAQAEVEVAVQGFVAAGCDGLTFRSFWVLQLVKTMTILLTVKGTPRAYS